MGADQIKKVLHLRIEQADERFLRILYAMTEAYASEHLEEEITDEQVMAIPPNPEWKRLTKAELKAEIDEANAEFERGESITLDELEKEAEQW